MLDNGKVITIIIINNIWRVTRLNRNDTMKRKRALAGASVQTINDRTERPSGPWSFAQPWLNMNCMDNTVYRDDAHP